MFYENIITQNSRFFKSFLKFLNKTYTISGKVLFLLLGASALTALIALIAAVVSEKFLLFLL